MEAATDSIGYRVMMLRQLYAHSAAPSRGQRDSDLPAACSMTLTVWRRRRPYASVISQGPRRAEPRSLRRPAADPSVHEAVHAIAEADRQRHGPFAGFARWAG